MDLTNNDTLFPAAILLVFVLAFSIVFWAKYEYTQYGL